ncbi:cytochrome [Stenotrophomonas sp. WZN-1]|uniref:cytochrome P450 n=1 Tax=Stenotrophomonas sp. WZN-1 TaxID=2005046 RepID=UPI000B4446D4|nr:cytochrome P450 [Stenotrophomonas sp. WZN-1]ARZ74229.1 cytochrome [Stenotrophomonas sp. WZN-1]
MDERAAVAEVVSIDDLLERVRREGPVLRFNNDVVGIFDPALAVRIDKANTDQHTVPDSLIDFLGLRSGSDRVAWREVRALLSEQAGRLASPGHMRDLYTRMHGFLAQRADRPHDLSELSWWTISQSLLPLLIDGLSRSDVDALIGEQKTRYNAIVLQNFSFWRRIIDFHLSRRAARTVSRHIRRRARETVPREDFLQSLLPLVQRVGVDRVAYLVSMVLAGMSGLPGITAASLLYAMHRFPHWHVRIREETSALSLEQLYALPIKSLPCTSRFVKETLRLWPGLFALHRPASHDIDIEGVCIRKGGAYELSSYFQHHSPEYWQNPDSFDPDRWLPERRQANKGAYVPFGFSSRACIGSAVGHAQLLLFCALVTRDFELTVQDEPTPWMQLEGFAIPVDFIGTLTPRHT